jgi:hypothetical protein
MGGHPICQSCVQLYVPPEAAVRVRNRFERVHLIEAACRQRQCEVSEVSADIDRGPTSVSGQRTPADLQQAHLGRGNTVAPEPEVTKRGEVADAHRAAMVVHGAPAQRHPGRLPSEIETGHSRAAGEPRGIGYDVSRPSER